MDTPARASLDDLQAATNALHTAEIGRAIGELTLRATQAEAMTQVWRDQARKLEAEADAVRAELAEAQAQLGLKQAVIEHLQEEVGPKAEVPADEKPAE